MKKNTSNLIVNLQNNFFSIQKPLSLTTKRVFLLLAFLLFVGNAHSQTPVFDTNHPDLRTCGYNCTANNASVTNVYLSATVDGIPLENFNPSCNAGVDTYNVIIWMNYTQNQANDVPDTRLFATLNIGGVTTEINKYIGTLPSTKGLPPGKIQITSVAVPWVCGQSLSFTNILVVWKSKITIVDGTTPYACSSYLNSQCDYATSTVFSSPLAVQFTNSTPCTTGTVAAVQFTNTTNGGSTPYSYLWDFGDGSTSTAASPLHNYTATGGTKTVTLTVTDSKGIVNSKTKTIFLPYELQSPISSTNVSCNGDSNGTATALPTGGTGTYTYSWNTSPIQTTPTITGLSAGTYTVTVKDANLCTVTNNVTIAAPATLTLTATPTQIGCFGGTGSVSLSTTGGTSPYTYAAGNPATTGLAAGTYTYNVTDANGCTASSSTTILAEPSKPAKISTPVTICSGETYTWTVNNTAYTTAGTYLVTNDGCTANQELVLIVTPKPAKISTPVTICSGETYTWTVNNTAYTTAGTYLVTNDGCTANQELVLTVTPKPAKISTPVTICSGETYTWAVNGTVYSTAGTYLVTNDGCTANQELVLTVTPKPAKISTPVTICSGETYTWTVNNTAYTTAGTYLVTNDGCTANQELVLTVTPKPAKISTPVTICSGETYTWAVNGTVYSTAGTYLVTNDGCTANQELVLTVTPKPAKISTPVTICSGETYTWAVNNTTYTTAGTYLVTNDGCTANQELVLTVTPKPAKVSTPVIICSGETYTWAVNGTVYSTAGTYLVTNDGCTANQELVLTVTQKPAKVSTPVTICSGETYTWAVNGTVYNTTGTYLVTNDGCTANQELVLTVTPKPAKISTPVIICSGETYTWAVNNTAYTTAGTYLVTNDGCTANQELVLTVTQKPAKVSTPVTICSGETYTWAVNGTVYNTTGTYLVTNDGCTANQELVLTVTPKPAKISTPVTICSGETYTWAVNNTTYTTAGTYLVTNDGCTANQELVLTVTQKPAKVSTPVTICSGETYTWAVNGTVYSTAGTYLVTNDGCTANQELVLTVTPKPAKVSTPVIICSGETYTWAVNGTVYSTAGTYLVTNDGCTANQELVLTVTQKPAKVSTPVTICSGETYTWAVNGTVYNTTGTYLVTNDGCTANQELVLTVTPKPAKISTPVTICSGETYTWAVNNTTYTTAGTYLVTNDGCTANQELVLTVTPKPAKISTPVTICSGETYTWAVNNTAYTTAGTYLVTNDGCTANQELVLTVTQKPAKVSTPVTICSGETYTWAVNGTVYNTTGTYLVTNDGCTANQELVLTVTPKPTKVSTPVTICSGETYTWAVNNTAYTTAGTYLVTNDGCTANQELVLTVTPKPAKVSTPVTICSGETYTWAVNTTAYTTAGTYLVTNDGCTANQELVLTVTPKPAKVSTPVTICSGETYTWAVNNTTYTTAGTYLVTNDGCTANQELVLTVTPKPAKVSTPVIICSGETYTWAVNGTVYNTTGTYLVTNDGCTANQELVLTVTPKPAKISTPVTICSGETYTWTVNNTTYTTAGTYLVTNDGCTANQELVLTVTPKPAKISTPVTICSGETYTWAVNNTTYTTAGTYLVTNDGCTANQELVLTVTPKPAKVSTPVTICSGETYTWAVNGTVYSTAGTYLVTNDGCTANQELVLTVTPKPAKVSTPVTICSGETYTWAVNGTVYSTAGTYLVTNDGCTANQELVLTINQLTASKEVGTISCKGGTTTVTITATGGIPPYTNDGEHTVYAGSYSFNVTDAKGCVVTVSGTIADGDDTPPVIRELPSNSTINCPASPVFVQATAYDNSGTEVILTFEDVKTNGVCAGSYSITRTWTAKDACENISTASQTINVQDLVGPTTTTVFPASVDATCDAIPAKPDLVFVDNCSTVATPVYTEKIINQTLTSYSIEREWNVADTCGNTSKFVQIVNVTVANGGVIVASSACNADSSPINLNDLLPAGTPATGTWSNTDNIITLQGSMFNPLDVPVGDYVFEYRITDGDCPTNIKINMNVNIDCKVLGCESIVVHNTFTPNWDGKNDVLIIDGVNDSICYPSGVKVEIYNRWGVLVFETNKYNNTSNAFEGYSKGRTTISQSSGLPTGTYFYILNYESFDGNGNIQINKKDGFLYLSR